MYKDCTKENKCSNCNGKHPATSRDCPLYKLEKLITERKYRNNLIYPVARDQIIAENPNIASQIPNLKIRKNNSSYSTAAASTPAAAQAQTQILNYQNLFMQQQKTILEQQKQIRDMQIQLQNVISMLGTAQSSSSNTTIKSNNNKRVLHNSSSDEDDNTPSSKKSSSERPEPKQKPNSLLVNTPVVDDEEEDPPEVTQEDTANSGSTAAEGVEVEGMEVNTASKPQPPAAPSTATPSVPPPDSQVKENVKAGSSGPSKKGKDQKSAVSKDKTIIKPISPPPKGRWK